jgi:FAD/FMN-containing dehydrogenase
VTSRKYGLSCDNVVGLEIVDANGDRLRASSSENSYLLWACCGGGGGNFGIVTALDIRVRPIGLVGVCNVTWPWQTFVDVVDTWQHWAPDVSDDLSTFLRLAVGGCITLFGQFTPNDPAQV